MHAVDGYDIRPLSIDFFPIYTLIHRDQEIQHIARSIEELSQIFKELAVLVIDQGTVLDRIDFNMEQVVGK